MRNKILAIIEEVLSIKFPFIRDLGMVIHSIILLPLGENDPTKRNCRVQNNIKTEKFLCTLCSNFTFFDK